MNMKKILSVVLCLLMLLSSSFLLLPQGRAEGEGETNAVKPPETPAQKLEKTSEYDEINRILHYTVKVNPDASDLMTNSDVITLADTMSDNLMLLPDSVEAASNGETLSLQAPIVNMADNGFTLVVPDETAITLTYDVYVLGAEGSAQTVQNEISIVTTDEKASCGDSFTLINTPTAAEYTLTVNKKDAATCVNLPEAEFCLAEVTVGENGIETGEQTVKSTGEDGIVSFTGLVRTSVYALQETDAPEGYKISSDVRYIAFADNETAQQLAELERSVLFISYGATLYWYDIQETGSIAVTKKDAETGAPLSGAVFCIYSDSSCEQLQAAMDPTDANGVSDYTDINTGTWYVKEQTAPEGYLLNETVFTVTVEADGTALLEVEDEPDVPDVPDQVGSLNVTKTVTGNGADLNKMFRFTVTLTGSDLTGQYGQMIFDNGTAEFTLKNGGTITAEGIPAGLTYTVAEDDYSADGYVCTEKGATGTITDGVTAKAEFTNTKDLYGSLTVKNTVDGNAADKNKAFEFIVTLSDTALTGTYGEMKFTNGVAEFSLKNGEKKTASNLPAGITFTVAEKNYSADGYSTTSVGVTGTISTEKAAEASFTNTRNQYSKLIISKKVSGAYGDQSKYFTFKVEFNAEGVYRYEGSISGSISNGGSIRLKHGQSVTISGLPVGTKYKVTESDNAGYVVYVTGSEGTISENKNSEAAFTNNKNTASNGGTTPKTGDDRMLALYLAITVVSFAGILVVVQVLRKRKVNN